MRVLIINTSERTGGAAVAANRLMEALNNNGVKAKMLVREKETKSITVVGLKYQWLQRWRFLWERWTIFSHLHWQRNHLFEIDIANTGANITNLPEFREADIIHLNWINQGMLSLKDIHRILASGKPVVWTMHDMWPATAICHYTKGCKAFTSECRNCQLLPGKGSKNDLANKTWKRKQGMMKNGNITFVTCSRWLEGQAKQSQLLRDHHVMSIPNCIDTHTYKPQNKMRSRQEIGLPVDKRLLLFVSQRVTDERKGMNYLIEAIEKIVSQHPEWKENTGVAILGGQASIFQEKLSLPVYPLGYVSDEKKIVDVYSSVDAFVIPSLEDNLPNTVMEALSCGVPCVGFKTGGIPEMIDHRKNGYIAEYRNSSDLADGIKWVIDEADRVSLSQNALRKVALSYSQHSVAMKYIEAYNQASAFKRYRI